jgi:hypothetical protein
MDGHKGHMPIHRQLHTISGCVHPYVWTNQVNWTTTQFECK